MKDTEQSANEWVASTRGVWAILVRFARDLDAREVEHASKTLASAAGVGAENVKEKILAIRSALASGKTEEEVITQGQRKTTAQHRKARAEKRLDRYVLMGWLVTPETKHAFKEKVYEQCQVLHIRDSETYFTWLLSEMMYWTPQQLRHSAGCPILKMKKEAL